MGYAFMCQLWSWAVHVEYRGLVVWVGVYGLLQGFFLCIPLHGTRTCSQLPYPRLLVGFCLQVEFCARSRGSMVQGLRLTWLVPLNFKPLHVCSVLVISIPSAAEAKLFSL